MKRGYYILIAGAVIFALGIALTLVWALPIAEQLQRDTRILQGFPLVTGQSTNIQFEVTDPAKPLSIVISAGNPIAMSAVLVDPDGREIMNREFHETFAEGARPSATGTYKLTITNESSTDTTVDVVFGHIPGVGEDTVDSGAFSGVITGASIIIVGVMAMIGGMVVTVLDRHKK